MSRKSQPARIVSSLLGAVLGSLVVAWLTACSGSAAMEEGTALSREPLTVRRGGLAARVVLSGELVAEAAEQLVVPNVNIWPVQIRWLAEDGAEVREGDKVVEFDDSQLIANLEEIRIQAIEALNRLVSLEARVASEEAAALFEIEQKRAAASKARLQAEVPEEIYAALEFQKLQLDRRKAELELAEAQANHLATRQSNAAEIAIQKIAVDKARAEVVRSEAKIDLLTLRASRDGILILGTERREGRILQAGDAVFAGNVVARLPDLNSMIVTCRLFDVDDGQIAVGMEVSATLDAFPDLTFSGRVREIDQIADQANARSMRRFFRTQIVLDQLDVERMRPGMSVKVVIDDRHDDVLLVPRRSLDWTEGQPRALLADGSWAAVDLGACDVDACAVEGGLEEGAALGRVGRSEVPG